MDKTTWEVASAAEEQSRRKANLVAPRTYVGNLTFEADPRIPPNQNQKKSFNFYSCSLFRFIDRVLSWVQTKEAVSKDR